MSEKITYNGQEMCPMIKRDMLKMIAGYLNMNISYLTFWNS